MGYLCRGVIYVSEIFRAAVPAPLRRWRRSLLDRRNAERDAVAAIDHLTKRYILRYVPMVESIYRQTGETHNFTYDLAPKSIAYLAEILSISLNQPVATISGFIDEAMNDVSLQRHILEGTNHAARNVSCVLGRRLAWYATARATKPKVIVETGVERGHGAVTLCAALLRNAKDGYPGRYFGTELRTEAGSLLTEPYNSVGEILYGDSITTLKTFGHQIDLFINDSDHSGDYEYNEYRTIAGNLSPKAILIADNAHVSDSLLRFSRETGRRFLFFREEPIDHWYRGAGLGISFR